MYKYYIIVILLLGNVSFAVTNEELLKRHQQHQKKIAPKKKVYATFTNQIKSKKDIPAFVKQLRKNKIKASDYYWQFLNLNDFGENIKISTFFNSIEYKYVLKNIRPEYVSRKNDNSLYIAANYMERKPISFTFPIGCKYVNSTKKIENLGYVEGIVNTFSMKKDKNVFYDVYECGLKKSDMNKIKKFGRGLGTEYYSKALSKFPFRKYVKTGQTYNKYEYKQIPEKSTSSGDGKPIHSKSNTSQTNINNVKNRGVKKMYDGGYKSNNGHTIYKIECNNGRRKTAYRENDGYWYDVGRNYGSNYRNLSPNEFANKICE